MQSLTSPARIRALQEKYGLRPSKGFGQNFLVNAHLPGKICDAAGITGQTNVLEIGPGFGALTDELARRARKVAAVEADARLLPVLAETLAAHQNVKIIPADIMQADIAAIIRDELDGRCTVCANLPYNITSPVIMRLLEGGFPIDSLTLMVQKEAAARIIAPPGTREAGAISYAVWYRAAPSLCFSVPPGNFLPPPKVTSAVIRLNMRTGGFLPPEREKRLFRLIRASFAQRRKTLANSASAGLALPKEALAAALAAAGIAPAARPETLTLDDFIRLEGALY